MVNNTTNRPAESAQLAVQRGNFYFGLGFFLLAGLAIVIALGVYGISGLGILTPNTAFAMTGIAIALISLVIIVTLISLRRTIDLLSKHDSALIEQAARHADLAAKVQSQWRAEQVIRDRTQDDTIAAISKKQGTPDSSANGSPSRLRAASSSSDPFEGGLVYPVLEVEGIGEHYSAALVVLGLEDTRQLWNADTAFVGNALEITPAAVESWQCMAELMAVKGIGKQYAELLVRADVSSIDELCAETAQPLLSRIHKLEKHQGNRIQGNTIGTKIVQSWINSAQTHHGLNPLSVV